MNHTGMENPGGGGSNWKKTSMGCMDIFWNHTLMKAVFTNSVNGTFLFDHSNESNQAAFKVFHLANIC